MESTSYTLPKPLEFSETDPYFEYMPNELMVQMCQGMTDDALAKFARTHKRISQVCERELRSRNRAAKIRAEEKARQNVRFGPKGGAYYISPRKEKVYMSPFSTKANQEYYINPSGQKVYLKRFKMLL